MRDNIDESHVASDCIESIEIIVNALRLDPIAIGKLLGLLSDKTYTTIQKIPYIQLKKYIDGENQINKT